MKDKFTVLIRITDLEEGKVDITTKTYPKEDRVKSEKDITPALALGHFAVMHLEDLISGARSMDQKTSQIILTNHINKK